MGKIQRKTAKKQGKKPVPKAAALPVAKPVERKSAAALGWAGIIEVVLSQIAEGRSTRDIVAANPGWNVVAKDVHLRIVEDDELLNRYLKARRAAMMADSEEILSIADANEKDFELRENNDGSVTEVVNREHIQRSKLRIETRMRLLESLDPNTFGKRVDLSNKDGSFSGLWVAALKEANAPIAAVQKKDETKH